MEYFFSEQQPSCPEEADICSGGTAIYTTAAWALEINGQQEATQFNPENMTRYGHVTYADKNMF